MDAASNEECLDDDSCLEDESIGYVVKEESQLEKQSSQQSWAATQSSMTATYTAESVLVENDAGDKNCLKGIVGEFTGIEVIIKPIPFSFLPSLLPINKISAEYKKLILKSDFLALSCYDVFCTQGARQNACETLRSMLPPEKPPDEFMIVMNETHIYSKVLVDVCTAFKTGWKWFEKPFVLPDDDTSYSADIHMVIKIESTDSVPNLHPIVIASGGAMVVRAVLGPELLIEKVSLLHEEIIRKSRSLRKVVIIATNMLEKMIVHPTPTRTEVSNVTIAVRDITDAVMLFWETALGKFTLKAVKVMQTVSLRTEASMGNREMSTNLCQNLKDYTTEMFAYQARMISNTLGTLFLVFTKTGFMVILLSHYWHSGTMFTLKNDKKKMKKIVTCGFYTSLHTVKKMLCFGLFYLKMMFLLEPMFVIEKVMEAAQALDRLLKNGGYALRSIHIIHLCGASTRSTNSICFVKEDRKARDHSNALNIAYEKEAAGRMGTTSHLISFLVFKLLTEYLR